MEIFTKIFLISVSGIFILLFMLLIEHQKKVLIGSIIFATAAISIVFDSIPLFILMVLIFCPFLIFLDVKQISWQKCLLYVIVFFGTLIGYAYFLTDLIPFYYYPFLVFFYALLAKKKVPKTDNNNVEF